MFSLYIYVVVLLVHEILLISLFSELKIFLQNRTPCMFSKSKR